MPMETGSMYVPYPVSLCRPRTVTKPICVRPSASISAAPPFPFQRRAGQLGTRVWPLESDELRRSQPSARSRLHRWRRAPQAERTGDALPRPGSVRPRPQALTEPPARRRPARQERRKSGYWEILDELFHCLTCFIAPLRRGPSTTHRQW